MIVGGFAVAVWGDPRPTRDVDVILDIKEGDGLRLAKAAGNHGLRVGPADVEDAIRERSHVTIFDPSTAYHVDVMPAHSTAHRMSLAGRKPIVVRGVTGQFASPEDTIANKLRFGSEQDVRDAANIYSRQRGKLDFSLLELRCLDLGVLSDFEALRKRVDDALK